jgi:hypothetical protein
MQCASSGCEDRWYAWLNEKWIPIPPDKIVPSYAPDGQAYLFMMDFARDFDSEPMFKIIVSRHVRQHPPCPACHWAPNRLTCRSCSRPNSS